MGRNSPLVTRSLCKVALTASVTEEFYRGNLEPCYGLRNCLNTMEGSRVRNQQIADCSHRFHAAMPSWPARTQYSGQAMNTSTN